jgi:tripartite-type tricarboxylate transporter receptor subunit TctC
MMKSEAVAKRMTTLGFEPAYAVIPDWKNRITTEIADMKALAAKTGIKSED